MNRFLTAVALCLLSAPAVSHDRWGNGELVEPWVKRQCCGPEDVHVIPDSAVHVMADGYHIDGIDTVVPPDRAMPSPDGKIYGFWTPAAEPTPVIFCFFYPLKGY